MNIQFFKKHELIDYTIKIIKDKAKIEVTPEQLLNKIADKSLNKKLKINLKKEVYINEIEYEQLSRSALLSVGYIPVGTDSFSFILSLMKIYNEFDEKQYNILEGFVSFLKVNSNISKLCFEDFIEQNIKKFGINYLGFIIDVIDSFTNYFISSPVYKKSKFGDITTIKLNDLFSSEKDNSELGIFFDQRYIDYLAANFEDLNKINWRKFEQLTAQFYSNEGFSVELGKGRKDGGIDVILKKDDNIIIIQCKRWENNVGIDVIRSLHDEVNYRQYSKGILFCSKDVSRDAKKMITERKYNIDIVNQEDIFELLNRYKSN